jgi:glycosyltransferase involved in cell wall biosynthesis
MARLTIGLPVHDGEAYLASAVASLLGQTFGDFVLIVCDNASTDGTADILADAARRDRRVRIVRNPTNIGAAPNWNLAFRVAETPLFKWAAHDDLYDPRYLKATVGVLDRDPGVVLCHTATRMIDGDGQELAVDAATGLVIDRLGQVRHGPPPPGRATSPDPVDRFRDLFLHLVRCFDVFGVIRTDVLRRTALHRSYYGSDRSLLVELSLHGRFHEVPEPLFLKREHGRTSLALSPADRARWIDPRARAPRLLPQRQHYLQVAEAVMRSPLGTMDRLRCLAVLAERADPRRFLRRRRPAIASSAD